MTHRTTTMSCIAASDTKLTRCSSRGALGYLPQVDTTGTVSRSIMSSPLAVYSDSSTFLAVPLEANTYLLATVIAIVFRSSRSAVIAGRSAAFWADDDVPSVELPDWEVVLSQYDRQALNLLATSVAVSEVNGGDTRRFNTCSSIFPTPAGGGGA